MTAGTLSKHRRAAAAIDSTGRYRYWLLRQWGPGGADARLVFLLLNPSTADARRDDPGRQHEC